MMSRHDEARMRDRDTVSQEIDPRARRAESPSFPTMIRDPDTLAALREGVARFVRDRLVPNEALVAETDAVPQSIIAR